MALLVRSGSGPRVGGRVIIWDFHAPIYTMSIQKWEQLADARVEAEEGKREIREVIKSKRIEKAFGSLSGEELFKPITKRLPQVAAVGPTAPAVVVKEEVPDYDMDEFDRGYPFYSDLDPDILTPPPPPLPPSPERVGEKWRRELKAIRRLITQHGHKPDYRVKSKGSQWHGYSIEDLQRAEKSRIELLEPPLTAPEPSLSADEEAEGSGIGATADGLIHRLFVATGSIKAGNTSAKLKDQVASLIKRLVKRGVLTGSQGQGLMGKFTQ